MKYYNHRIICKYRYVLNHLNKLIQSNKLKQFTELKKDMVMHEVCEKNTPIERREILESRIKILEERVLNMSHHWQWQDRIYFKFSLAQKFHNQALAKGQRLEERHLKQRIFNRILSKKHSIQSIQDGSVILGAEKPRQCIQSWLLLEEYTLNKLSKSMQNRLLYTPKLIEMFRKKEELIIFPLFIFKFGDAQRAVDSLIKAKLESDYESQFYIYKTFVKKLFKRELNCQQQPLEEPILVQEYSKVMKRKLDQIQACYEEEKKTEQKLPLLDGIVQMKSIENSKTDEQVHLQRSEHKVEITLKELVLSFFVRNISVALTEFIDYINADPEILKLMADPNYEKYHSGIAKMLKQEEFCILINDLIRLSRILSRTKVDHQFNQTLYFTFNSHLKVGYVWTEPENDQSETEKEEDQENNDNHDNDHWMKEVFSNDDPQPSKKVKTD